jgi:hypothetical protein
MLTDLRKTALIAGVTPAVSALWSSFVTLMVDFALHRMPQGLLLATVTLLPGLPLVALLLLLGGTRTVLLLSKRQRYLTMALAVVSFAGTAVSALDWWRHGLNENASRASLRAISFWLWFAQSPARLLISDALALVSAVAFALFIVALSRQAGVGQDADGPPLPRIRTAALVATMTGGLFLVLSIASQYSLMGRFGNAPNGLSILRTAIFRLPGLIVPWIVYATVRSARSFHAGSPGSYI